MVLTADSDSIQPSAIAAAEGRLMLLLPEVGAGEIDLKKSCGNAVFILDSGRIIAARTRNV